MIASGRRREAANCKTDVSPSDNLRVPEPAIVNCWENLVSGGDEISVSYYTPIEIEERGGRYTFLARTL